jgi:hypothetical protein
MLTKWDHIRNEIAEIIDSVDDLTAITSRITGQEAARPYALIQSMGWVKRFDGADVGEKDTTNPQATLVLEINIKASSDVGLEEERNRIDEALEHAFDTSRITDFENDSYVCHAFIHEYEGASGLYNRDEDKDTFLATVSIRFIQTPK